MPDVTVATLGDALAAGSQALEAAGLPTPRREARQLLAAVVGVDPGALWLCLARALEAETADRYRDAIAARSRGAPAAYAVGVQPFRTIDLRTDPRALIPRPETEGLVELVLAWATRRWGSENWGTVADVGTGTGCIALALAVEGAFQKVIAVDRSAGAVALARENVRRINPPTPVEVLQGDLVAPLDGAVVDVLVSNPPYLTRQDFDELEEAVACYEPAEALVSGPSGIEIADRLLREGLGVVQPDGLLALEMDCRRASHVAKHASALGWSRVRVMDDLAGRPRYLLAQWEVE